MARTIAGIAAIVAALALAGCSGDFTGLASGAVPARKENGEFPSGFYENLANEYANLSTFESEYLNRPDQAAWFSAKAKLAQGRQPVGPDNPQGRNIPDFARDDLAQAYAMLGDALGNINTENNGALLAMAQTRYDCWLAHQEIFPDKDAYIGCKTGFYDALSLLDVPAADIAGHDIYFETGSIEIDEQARKAIGDFVERYRDKPYWDITLRGFADHEGNKDANRVLSMRRAIAVKNMLGQYGLDLDSIAISAEGQERKKEAQNGRRVEIRAWPHYVARNKEGLSVIAGWTHSGEF